MPRKKPEEFQYISNNPDFVPDPEISQFMNEEIGRAPSDPHELVERLQENPAASPLDSGGDIDASWEEVNSSGTESVSGDNPTPDQNVTEEIAHAVGVNYEDNEELEFIDKIERRDRNRFELDPRSKTEDDTI